MEHFFQSDYMPHGHCYFWEPAIVWTHAISDTIIAIAYFIIPLALIHIVRKRQDFRYIWMGILFAVFILGCGTTHIFDVINIWEPWYKTDSAVRVITALASIGTAIVLIKVTPQILLIPSADKWKQVNADLLSHQGELLKSNEELTKTEKILVELNSDLEAKVLQRTEESQKKAQELEFLADSIPQLVWISAPEGNTEYFNKRWYDYTGLSSHEELGTNWVNHLHPDHYEKTLEYWHRCLETGEEYNTEYCLRNKEGEYRWFLAKAVPMKDTEGNIIKWFGTCTDINSQKLQTKELEATNKNLKRINNDLDNFIYTASHDLKAPISNMEGLLDTIYEEAKDVCSQDVIGLFSMLEISIKRLKATIDDLTDISRIQKNIDEDKEQIDVSEILKEYEESHEEQIQKFEAKIYTDFSEKYINFSKKNFKSLFYNLLNNAIKYHHPERAPEIQILCKREGEFVLLSVSDNGIGFDPNQKEKIFGMFKRMHSHVEGSGVGLYIVKRIIENSNGIIEADSEVGKGSVFKVYFPAN